MSKQDDIVVDGIICRVWVQKTSASIWNAHGEFDGKTYYGKGTSELTAKQDWKRRVESRDSCV